MVNASVSLHRALDETRTGDIWLFRGSSGPDRAIQSMTNSPVNHVGMTVAIEDLPPLIWHAELGDKLTDMWTGSNHRGVQLNDARGRGAVDGQLPSALLAASADAVRQPRAGGSRAEGGRPDGRHTVSQHRAADRPLVPRPAGRHATSRAESRSCTARFVKPAQRRKARSSGRPGNGVLRRDRRDHLRGDGSADHREALQLVRRRLVLERRLAALAPGYRLGDEIAVLP